MKCSKVFMRRPPFFRAALGATCLLPCLLLGAGCDDDEARPGDDAGYSTDAPSSPPALTDESPTLPDSEITAAVERELLLDGTVNSRDVRVEVTNGIVELMGAQTHLLAKRRAGLLASAVKGVRSISNQIVVHPVERADSLLESDVKAALLEDPTTESFEIGVSVADQVVTLEGTVQSWAERDLAERLSLSVRGVRDVENEIEVDYGADRTDLEIKRDIESQLRWNALVEDALIDVEVVDGLVILTGTVGSLAEKLRTARDANWVLGVDRVDTEELKVEWWANKEDLRKDKYVIKRDTEIVEALDDALVLDPRVNSYDIAIAVQGGTATLTGEVGTPRAKNVAAQIARDTMGVAMVRNRISVEPETMFDNSELENRIETALERNPIVEQYEIAVTADAGIVTLTGVVDSFAEMAEAEGVVSGVPGVVGVMNDLEVSTPTPVGRGPYVHPYSPYIDYIERWESYVPESAVESDPEIRESIRDELFWSPFVDSDNIIVSVEDGEATLHGTVSHWRESAAATENAFEGGALSVNNQLVLVD